MIPASELRINNWVIGIYGTPMRVGVIMDGPNEAQPIPLTPELLEKCGFELKTKHSFWCYMDKIGFGICMWAEDEPCAGFEKKGCFYYGDNYLPVEYLHDFQNIYFAHMRKELIINL